MAYPPCDAAASAPGTAAVCGLAALAAVAVLAPAVGGCAMTGAWWWGAFTDHGRLHRVDACPLLPPDTLRPLVGNRCPTARVSGTRSARQLGRRSDAPFRAVGLQAETGMAEPPYRGVTQRARELLATRRLSAGLHGACARSPTWQKRVFVDRMSIQIVFAHTDIYDVHGKFPDLPLCNRLQASRLGRY